MTEADLRDLEAMLEKAQPGPWKSFIEGRDHDSGSNFIMTGVGSNRGEDIELSGATRDDQDFIAATRNALPLLIAEIRRLRMQA